MPFIGKNRVLNHLHERILNFQCVVRMARSFCTLQRTFQNQSVFLLTPMSTPMGKSFRLIGQLTYIRSYNNAVSFTSLGAKLDRAITDNINGAGVYTFRIHGALHHSMGSLLPPPGERPRFAQVYMFDSR